MPTPSEPLYREIPLSQGQIALVSASRFKELNAYKWSADWSQTAKSFYAVRHCRKADGKQTSAFMHRAILGLEFGDKRQGDHVNMNTLDNRDENLRIATPSENQRNRGKNANNTSGFKGVYWRKDKLRWVAQIGFDGKKKYLGLFATAQEAHRAYCEASQDKHGNFSHQ